MYFQIPIILFTTIILASCQDQSRINEKEKQHTKRHIFDVFDRNPIFRNVFLNQNRQNTLENNFLENSYIERAPNPNANHYVYQIPPLEWATPIEYVDYKEDDFYPTAESSSEEDTALEDTIYAINPYLIFNLENCIDNKENNSGGVNNCNISQSPEQTVEIEENASKEEVPIILDVSEINQIWPLEPSKPVELEDETNTDNTSETSDEARPVANTNVDTSKEETASEFPEINVPNSKPIEENETGVLNVANNENSEPIPPIKPDQEGSGEVENEDIKNDVASNDTLFVSPSIYNTSDNATDLLLNNNTENNVLEGSETPINELHTPESAEDSILYTSTIYDDKSSDPVKDKEENQDTLHNIQPTSTNIDLLDQLNSMLDTLHKKTNYSDPKTTHFPKTKPNSNAFFPNFVGPNFPNTNGIDPVSDDNNGNIERIISPMQVIRNLLLRAKQGLANVVVNSFNARRVPQGPVFKNGYRDVPPRYFPKFDRSRVVQDVPRNEAVIVPSKVRSQNKLLY